MDDAICVSSDDDDEGEEGHAVETVRADTGAGVGSGSGPGPIIGPKDAELEFEPGLGRPCRAVVPAAPAGTSADRGVKGKASSGAESRVASTEYDNSSILDRIRN